MNAPGGQRARLLVVEDEDAQRSIIVDILRGRGYTVAEAPDADAALAHLATALPDLVLCDWKMPGRTGGDLLDEVRARELPCAFIVMTAYGSIAHVVEAMRRGADDYLAKPFEPDELLVRLDNLVRTRRLLQQRFTAMLSAPESVEDPVFELENVFLQKIREVVETHLSDADFDMPQLERALGMSHSQVFRKVKALTGHSPSVLIRTIRLHKSRELLKDRSRTIAEVAYEVGFSSPAYFSTMFLEAFGKTPSDFRQM